MRTHKQNVDVGRKKQVTGAKFEGWVNGQHEIARRYGILAHVMKNEPKAEYLGGKLVHTAASVSDYTGTLDRTGKSLAVEAKSTTGDKFYKSVVSVKQQEHLGAVARAGGLALLLLEFTATEPPIYRRFAVLWLAVPWHKLRSAESVSADALANDNWHVRVGDGECYLERFHSRGAPSSPVVMRSYARE